jgi:DNA-binding beta-propeller fold protein YncE
MLCACSTNSIAPNAPLASTAAQAVNPATIPGGLLFVSDALRQEVRIYEGSSDTLWGKIPFVPLPGGLAVDASRNLYVAGFGGVNVYPPPYSRATLRLSMLGRQALAVAVAPNGSVAAIDARNIFVFASGSQEPCIQYAPPNYGRLTSVAFDSKSDLFFTGYDTSRNVAISKMQGHCGNVNSTQLTIGNTLRSANGVAIGPNDQLSVLDTAARTIFTYRPPSGNSLGNPIASTLLQRQSVRTPVAFAFDATHKSVYTADSASGRVDEFAFPKGGAPTDTLTIGGQPVGVAIVPPYLPKAQ